MPLLPRLPYFVSCLVTVSCNQCPGYLCKWQIKVARWDINSWNAGISGGFFSSTDKASLLRGNVFVPCDRQLCLTGMCTWSPFSHKGGRKSYLWVLFTLRNAPIGMRDGVQMYSQHKEVVLMMVLGKLEGIKRLVISYGMPWWQHIKSLKSHCIL